MHPFSIRRLLEPQPRYIWAQVRILHETNKAILVTVPHVIARSEATKQSLTHCHFRESGTPNNNNIKIWIPKSQILGIRLRKGVFEIYVKESAIG